MIAALTAIEGVLSGLGALASAAGPPAAPTTMPPTANAPGGSSFADLFAAAVGRLDAGVAAAQTKAASFASGADDIPLSDVMIALEQANLGLQMAANVRDRVVAAYSNVMNMQV